MVLELHFSLKRSQIVTFLTGSSKLPLAAFAELEFENSSDVSMVFNPLLGLPQQENEDIMRNSVYSHDCFHVTLVNDINLILFQFFILSSHQ